MSSLTFVWRVKCMPSQFNHFIQLSVTKDALMDGWHVLKIYKHVMYMTKSQPNLAHVVSIAKSQFNMVRLAKSQPCLT